MSNRLKSKVVLCPECGKRLVKIISESFNAKDETHNRVTVGRVCKRCNIIFLNPYFKDYKQKINKLGEDIEEEKN